MKLDLQHAINYTNKVCMYGSGETWKKMLLYQWGCRRSPALFFSVVSIILWHPYIVKPNHVWNPITPVVWLRLPDSWWVHTDSHLGVWGSNCTIQILPRPCPSLVAPVNISGDDLGPCGVFSGFSRETEPIGCKNMMYYKKLAHRVIGDG